MPIGENWWNPYRFVPIREPIERRAPRTHQRFGGISGTLSCSISNLTPLFIGASGMENQHESLRRDGKYVIPGSSIKGMLRSLVEIIGGGCFVASDKHVTVPEGLNACDSVDHLCIACRMFGAMERGSHARVHTGHVHVGDAVLDDDGSKTIRLELLLGTPKWTHRSFYLSPHTGERDGKCRKVYFHQPRRTESALPVPASPKDRASNVTALRKDHRFRFDVQFDLLSEDEYSILLYSLALENDVSVKLGEDGIRLRGPMRHKIGYGKPAGLGSCEIDLLKLTILPEPDRRFTSLRNEAVRILEGERLAQHVREMTACYWNDASSTMTALRKMMVWDPDDIREFRYPDYSWFRDNNNRSTTLKSL